jgi:signal transduction histidine kinase
LRNACTYTDAGSVTVVVDGDHVDIVDTGVGMNAEELEQAFDPYFRGGMRKPGGQGVGLTIVRRLSTRFGWPVRLFSEAGQGTTARIEFTQIREVDCDGVDAQHPACRHCTKVHVS